MSPVLRNAFAAVLVGLTAAGATTARADPKDNEFQLVEDRLISRLDMSPGGMRGMTAMLEPLEGTLPGYYRFETNLLMEGGWALTVAAKVPGEPNAVRHKLVLHAVP